MLFVAYLLLLFASVTCQNDLGIIKQRVVASLLPNDDHEAEEIAKQATGYEESLSANGSWPDIDYKDETRGGWKTAEHLSRVKVMCIAFRSLKSPVCNNTRLAYAIHDALDFWLIHDFKNPNWWYNEIGVPLDIANSYLLFEAQLTVNEKLKGIMIMERATWWKGWTGANLVWMCNIQVQRGLLTSNETAVTQCLDRIYKEIFIGHQQQDGIQTDGSFHQHGPELLAGSYGNVFTSQILGYINYTLGTKYFMSDDTLSIFSHLVLDGQQWMIYGGVWDWSVIGRECSSPRGSGDAMSPAMLQEVPGSRHQEYVNFANRIINKFNPPLVGTVYYWDSDYMVHRQPGYMVSLHMHSNRTIPARCVNSQGIKSEHFADGVVNLYYTGQEYDNIFPVWDWQRLPGITCEQNIPLLPCNYDFPVNSSNFVGGVTDNEHGVAAMHLLSHSLSSLNSWFFFPDVYVAMGTNVTCTSGNPVFTSLANQILDGNVTVKVSGDSTPLTLNTGNHSFLLRGLTDEDDDDDELLWVHHGNTGYFPLDDDEEKMAAPPVMHVNNGPRTGDWSSIGTSHGTITLNVFDMYIDHQLPSGAPHHFQYAVTPLTGLSQMDTLYQSQANIKIISNTPAAQAIFNIKDKTLSAVVWAQNGAELNAGEGWQIQVTVAVLIIVSEDATTPGRLTISLSSPLYPTAEGVTVRIDRSMRCKQGLSWQKVEVDGLRVVTSVNVYLPDGDQWGSSVTLECMMD